MTPGIKDVSTSRLIPLHYEAKLDWFCCMHNDDGSINYDVKSELQGFMNELVRFNPSVPIRNEVYSFTFSIDDNSDVVRIKTTINAQTDGDNNVYYDYYDEIVIGRIKDLCFIINLAYPGVLHFRDGVIYRSGKPIRKHFKYSSDLLGWAYEEMNWPEFEELSIEECWNWIINKTNFLTDISITPIDRALHALSYSDASDNTYIFYVMLGIEAIYNDDSNKEDSILEQLKRKTKCILGKCPTNLENTVKKQINDMYRMRSCLVHGKNNIEKCWKTYDCDNNEYDKYLDQLKPMVTATGLLLATIQKFVKANANTITETITVNLE